jgi:hypothetical protein
MPLWSAEQLERVRATIARHHAAIALAVFGARSLPPDLLKDLQAAGIKVPSSEDLIRDPFAYGQLLAILRDPKLATKTVAEVAQLVAENKLPLALSEQERASVDMAQKHAGQYVVGLGARVAGQVMAEVTGAEANLTPERMVEIIRDKTAAAIAKRETIEQLKSDLGHSMGNWTRDWQRIATTEVNNAMQEGIAATIEKRGGSGAGVSKIPSPGACSACRAAYLDANGNPRIFTIGELRAHGSNVGRKGKNLRATVEGVHPWCACEMVSVSKGLRWLNGELVPEAPAESEDEAETAKSEGRGARMLPKGQSVQAGRKRAGHSTGLKVGEPIGTFHPPASATAEDVPKSPRRKRWTEPPKLLLWKATP